MDQSTRLMTLTRRQVCLQAQRLLGWTMIKWLPIRAIHLTVICPQQQIRWWVPCKIQWASKWRIKWLSRENYKISKNCSTRKKPAFSEQEVRISWQVQASNLIQPRLLYRRWPSKKCNKMNVLNLILFSMHKLPM